MPVSADVSKPVLIAVIVYVSGASESIEKRPEASVVTVAVCDGLTASTRAPATGPPVVLDTTPVIEPVVPAGDV
jgi:hypothetical protein